MFVGRKISADGWWKNFWDTHKAKLEVLWTISDSTHICTIGEICNGCHQFTCRQIRNLRNKRKKKVHQNDTRSNLMTVWLNINHLVMSTIVLLMYADEVTIWVSTIFTNWIDHSSEDARSGRRVVKDIWNQDGYLWYTVINRILDLY